MMQKICPTCSRTFPETINICPDDQTMLVPSGGDEELTGKVLDNRYNILKRIGRGGMGVVYEAEHKILKRKLAIKVLKKDIVQDQTLVKRFLTEARAIAALDNPHTVMLHDFAVSPDGQLYYTMELLEGISLANLIKEQGTIPLEKAAEYVDQACISLKDAHDRGILHRDIKPDNIFIVRKNGRETLKILDFGIAKLLDDSASAGLTMPGMVMGTPLYISPEQALGEAVSTATDLYALTVVLYEMLAGRPPFMSDSPSKILMAHASKRAPTIHKLNPAVTSSPYLGAFLAKSLSKDPKKRFLDAEKYAKALHTAIEGSSSGVDIAKQVTPETDADLSLTRKHGTVEKMKSVVEESGDEKSEKKAPDKPQQLPVAPSKFRYQSQELEKTKAIERSQYRGKSSGATKGLLILLALLGIAGGVAWFGPWKTEIRRLFSKGSPQVESPKQTGVEPEQVQPGTGNSPSLAADIAAEIEPWDPPKPVIEEISPPLEEPSRRTMRDASPVANDEKWQPPVHSPTPRPGSLQAPSSEAPSPTEKKQDESKQDYLTRLISEARHHMNLEDYSKAVMLLMKAEKEYPKNRTVRTLLMQCRKAFRDEGKVSF
jgi:serine/threonine protein kinase